MNVKKLTALFLAGALGASVFSGCGINKDAVAATMEGQEVTLGIVNFLCKYMEARYDDTYVSYYGEDVWNTDLYSSGSTLGEDMKDSVMEEIHTLYTLQQHMDDYDVTVSDEEAEAIKAAAEEFMSSNSEEALEEMGATQEIVEEVLTLYTIESKMYDAIIAEADTEVSDEEANMRGYTRLRVGISGYYDSSYSYISYTEDEIAEMTADVEAIIDEVESGVDLETAAEDYGYSTSYLTYASDDSSMDEEVKTVLDELAVGEMSEIIETDSYLYIVRLDTETDEEATESNRESIISDRQSDYYTEVLEGWQEDDGWTVNERQLAKIKFHNLFTQTTESTEDTESTESVESTESTESVETVDDTESVN